MTVKGVVSPLHGKCEARELPSAFRRRNRYSQYLLARDATPHAPRGLRCAGAATLSTVGPALAAARGRGSGASRADCRRPLLREIDAALETACEGVARESCSGAAASATASG